MGHFPGSRAKKDEDDGDIQYCMMLLIQIDLTTHHFLIVGRSQLLELDGIT
jgi:hypothetical protein